MGGEKQILKPSPELCGKVWRKGRDQENDRPYVAILESVRFKNDL